MTIEEFKTVKTNLQNKIENLLALFEEETSMAVTDVYLNTIPIGYTGDRAIYQIRVDVKI